MKYYIEISDREGDFIDSHYACSMQDIKEWYKRYADKNICYYLYELKEDILL